MPAQSKGAAPLSSRPAGIFSVKCSVTTTWREFLMDKSYTHTWMAFVPLLPRELDFPEILALRAPAATMVRM